MSVDHWWRYPVVSGAEPFSGFSGDSGVATAIEEAFPTPPGLEDAALMATGELALPGGPALSDADGAILAEVSRKAAIVLSQIVAVVDQRTNAFFIWGPGGHGKSYIVRLALQKWACCKWTTTDVSAKGLFNLLRVLPSHVHVFEDMERMYKQADCQAILRAACGGQSTDERTVCWEKDGRYHEDPFQFTGGIVIISNEDPRGPSLKMGAIASRFAPQEWRLTKQELAAMMRDIAIRTPCKFGYSPEERLEVAEFVIEEMNNRPTGIHVDLRTFCEHVLPMYHQWRLGRSVHWHEVVRAKIQGSPRRSCAEIEKEEMVRAACEAFFEGSNTDERIAVWKRRTGLGKSQFYEHLKSAKTTGMFGEYKHASESAEKPER